LRSNLVPEIFLMVNISHHNVPFVRFESIGMASPKNRLSTKEILSRIKLPGKFKFELLTGIKSRKICGPDEDSLSLAVDAAIDCLKHSHYNASEIELVISCSITKYRNSHNQTWEPAFSFLIKDAIGATKALSFDLANACAGMLTGIYVAHDFIQRGVVKNCLVVSGEFISGLIANAIKSIKTPASNQFASLTVGDAGAAVILEGSQDKQGEILLHGFKSLTHYNRLCTAYPRKGLPGAGMKTKAKKIHEVSIEKSIPIVKEALDKFGMKYSDIDYLLPHQTSKSAILSGAKTYSQVFNSHPGEVIINLSENGNTATTSHFISLYQYLKKGKFKANDKIMLISFASGLVFGIVVFEINSLIRIHGS